MFLVNLRDEKFNNMDFKFSSMEEVAVFTETVLKTSVNPVDVTISTKEVSADVETL